MQFSQQSKMKAITFSYDDGTTQDIRLINLMNKYNLKGTFNLNSALLGTEGLLAHHGRPIAYYKVHPSHVEKLYQGHEVAVHTLTHKDLTKCDDEELIRQVEEDRLRLSDLVGYEVVGMAYPYGGVDDRVVNLLRQHTGVKYSRTVCDTKSFAPPGELLRCDPTLFHVYVDELMELGRRFVEMQPDTPQIFSLWGHALEMDYDPQRLTRLEEFFRLISNRDDIFYGTNREVYL